MHVITFSLIYIVCARWARSRRNGVRCLSNARIFESLPLKEIARPLNHFCATKDTHTLAPQILFDLGMSAWDSNGETVTMNNLLFVPCAQSYVIIIAGALTKYALCNTMFHSNICIHNSPTFIEYSLLMMTMAFQLILSNNTFLCCSFRIAFYKYRIFICIFPVIRINVDWKCLHHSYFWWDTKLFIIKFLFATDSLENKWAILRISTHCDNFKW